MTLRLGGFVPWSGIDYPGRQAAVAFVSGCPWRCPYCHNSHLWAPQATISWGRVRSFLETRQGLLDALVISGGEPLAQAAGVAAALVEARDLGFAAGLHTAGVSPRRLAGLLPVLDWVGLDIKTAFGHYPAITGRAGTGTAARAAARLVIESGTPYELRTTVHPELISEHELVTMVAELATLGATALTLKGFRPTGCPSARLNTHYRPWLTSTLAQTLREIMPAIVLPDP